VQQLNMSSRFPSSGYRCYSTRDTEHAKTLPQPGIRRRPPCNAWLAEQSLHSSWRILHPAGSLVVVFFLI
jgi:hypothetical protein